MSEQVIKDAVRRAAELRQLDEVDVHLIRAPADARFPHVVVIEQGIRGGAVLDGPLPVLERYFRIECRAKDPSHASGLRYEIQTALESSGKLLSLLGEDADSDGLTAHDQGFYQYNLTVGVSDG